MSTLAWVAVAWFSNCIVTALRAHGGFGYVMPDSGIIVIAYLALRRDALQVVMVALIAGYLIGRQDLAPTGLYPLTLGTVALGTQLIAGSLAGSGPAFGALVTAAASAAYHALTFALLFGTRGTAGFANWWTAVLFPNALLTAFFGLLALPLFNALEKRLTADTHTALSWR
ncbi:MAG: hypothetical protein H7Z43_04505 [Clostridia bacterium]|nr:hypothetical protein [Deltaproteobacteria bacterium]